MTLTITNPVTSGPVGPGSTIRWHSTVALGATDIMRVTLSDGGGLPVLTGDAPAAGGVNGFVVIGKATLSLATPLQFEKYIAPGASVGLFLEQLNSGGMFLNGLLATGPYTWDPDGGLGHLMQLLFGSTSGTILDQILAAVTRTFE